jgi:hypothetical protein
MWISQAFSTAIRLKRWILRRFLRVERASDHEQALEFHALWSVLQAF